MTDAEKDWLLAHREVNAILNASLAKSAAGALLHPCRWKLDEGGVLRQGAEPTELRCDSCGIAYQDRGKGFCTHKFCPAAIRAEVANTAFKAVEEFVDKRLAGRPLHPHPTCGTCGGKGTVVVNEVSSREDYPCPACHPTEER